jgi:hypothetical protein
MLDTVTECQWAMMFKDQGLTVEEEAPFPAGGDADLRVTGHAEDLWLDCISPQPRDFKASLEDWLARVATNKWKTKFSSARGADTLPACIAVMLMKADEVMPALAFRSIVSVRRIPSLTSASQAAQPDVVG